MSTPHEPPDQRRGGDAYAHSIIPPKAPRRPGIPKLQLPSSRPSSADRIHQSGASIYSAASGVSVLQQQAPSLSLAIPTNHNFSNLSLDADEGFEGSLDPYKATRAHEQLAAKTTLMSNATQHASIYPDTVPVASGSRDPQALTNDLRRAIGNLSMDGSVQDRDDVEKNSNKRGEALSRNVEDPPDSNLDLRIGRSSGQRDLEDESELVLKGNLEMLDHLGEGASGEVRRARYKPTGLIMATKTISTSPNPAIHRQILRELAFNRTCHSDHIVRYYGAYLDNEDTSIVIGMENCEGGSLEGIYKRVKRRNGRMGEKVLAKIAESGLKGLAYLHERKIIHRDIKPSNILVTRDGQIKLCDFGVSGELIDSLAGTFTGTSFYMAPERIKGESYNITSDVWSLGLTILELASNRFPFPPENEPPLGPIDLLSYVISMRTPELKDDSFAGIKWTRAFRDFIEHCLEKNGAKRYGPSKMLNHPWLKKSMARTPQVDVGKFVAEVWGWTSPSAENPSTVLAENVDVPGLGRVSSLRKAPSPLPPPPSAKNILPGLLEEVPSQQDKVESDACKAPSPRFGPGLSLVTEKGAVNENGVDQEGRTPRDRAEARQREADVGLIGSPAGEEDAE